MRSVLGSSFFRARPEPSYPVLPARDARGETSVQGVFVVGECAGTPLLKLGMNEGARLGDLLANALASSSDPQQLDVLVVGAGAAGLACALRMKKRGLSVRVLDAAQTAQTVVSMTKGKRIFAEPHSQANESDLFLDECTREELLARWSAQLRDASVLVEERVRVSKIARDGDALAVETSVGPIRARRVVLAVGKSGNPRKAGVPGEDQPKVAHALVDAAPYAGKHALVYGGGDVACEAALALLGAGAFVTMVTVDAALTFPKKRNRDAIEAAATSGALTLALGARLARIDERTATYVDKAGASHTVDNELVLVMIGADAPVAFFKQLGLALEGAWTPRRVFTAIAVLLGVFTLYAGKKFPEEPASFPFSRLLDADSYARAVNAVFDVAFAPFAWMLSASARADVDGTLWFQQGYLYSLLYTLLMAGFGWQAFMRWRGIAKDPRHQRLRYATLIAFQVAFFLGVNVVGVQGLSVQYSWRGWGLYQPWPLFFHTFNWWSDSDPRAVVYTFVGAGLFGTFVVIPWLSLNHGKRFCTWVCGCGGLAETLGDRWRHLAPKGARSRAWEVQGLVVLVAVAVITLVTVGMYETRADNAWARAYAYAVDFWLVAVIPIAAYPFFGGKIWCRYWCPLAAYNGLLARWYGRLGIDSNDQCISCGQCSKQCQVGVDVMAFAKAQERFDNRSSSCIQCGICIDVCPVSVLSFSTKKPSGRSLPIVPG